MNEQIFNRLALMPGMILGRRSRAPISYAIMLRTAGLRATLDGTAWSHDGILIQHNGHWWVGDAELGHKARLVPLADWEAAMRRGDCKAIALWPTGAEPQDGQAAAWYWQTHIYGSKYDTLGVASLIFDWSLEALKIKAGKELSKWCSEGVAAGWFSGTTFRPDPWSPKLNPTPGTTRKRVLQGRLKVVHGAFTEYGRQFAIPLDA